MSKLRWPAALFSSTMETRLDRLCCRPRRYWNDLDKLLGSIEVNTFCDDQCVLAIIVLYLFVL